MYRKQHSQYSQLPVLAMATALSLTTFNATASVVDDAISQYQQQGASVPQVNNGKQLWTKTYTTDEKPQQRSCTSCHTENLRTAGKHIKTGKAIKPLAPSVNSERLTEIRKIEKWFKRNCKWTLGRECSVQEKADFLSYIRSQ